MALFLNILPTADEMAMSLPGDTYLTNANHVIDSAFTLPAKTAVVFPWFVQLGKDRAGWYFPRNVEHFIFPSKRGLRYIEPRWQKLAVGQRIPDYGGKEGYFDCIVLEQNSTIAYTSTRGKIAMTWALTFWPDGEQTRVIIRLRIKTRRNGFFLKHVGKLFDRLTIAGLAAGLQERLTETKTIRTKA